MDFRELHRVGDGLSVWDVKRLITDTLLYTLDKGALYDVQVQVNRLIDQIEEREQFENANRADRWWAPEEPDELLPHAAKCWLAGVRCLNNPKGDKSQIQAIKFLRTLDFFRKRTLKELKEITDAYRWQLATGQVDFPRVDPCLPEEDYA